jgi:hypothetical protein
MARHDVSEELRGAHGRWARSADALKRMGKEAESRPAPHEASGTEAKIASIEKGRQRRIGGVAVHHVSDNNVHVGFKKPGGGWDFKRYSSRAEAAKAVDAGKHHEEGAPAREVASKAAAGSEAKPDYRSMTAGELTRRLVAGRDQDAKAELDRRTQERQADVAARRRAAEARPDLGYMNQRKGQAEALRRIAVARQGGTSKSPSSLKVGETAKYPGGHTVTRTEDGGWQATIGGKRRFYAPNQAALLSVALRHGEHLWI